MLQKRHPGRFDGLLARTYAAIFAAGQRLPRHAHTWHQLVYASEGVLTVETDGAAWVVPPERAVLLPAGIAHAIEARGRLSMKTIYVPPTVWRDLGSRVAVIAVSPLLRELIVHAVRVGPLRAVDAGHVHLLALIRDRLAHVATVPVELREPRDPRARRVAALLRANPSQATPLADLGREVGASKRTLERLFRMETGMSLGRWRRQLRLLTALPRLAGGESVTRVAMEVGYESPSAFIAAFRIALGTTPGAYYRR